jgi:ATP-dependent helicase HrpA
VVVVAGETGSGKTTQLPKICLELGRGTAGMIGHTQPRRLAARTVAERVAAELGTELGRTVGYQVRFTDRVGRDTQVKLMTDGILLAELERDRSLRRYDTIIIDEAHERSLNVDFLLGYLARLLPRRPDLKLIITSATIDPSGSAATSAAPRWSRCPAAPIRSRSATGRSGLDADDDRDQAQGILDAVDELCREGPGDILVFLSGEREIRDTAEALRGHDFPAAPAGWRCCRCTRGWPRRAAPRVPGPHRRRVVLATNVAETSLTVPGVKYVVDPGTARISRYSHRSKVQRLPIEPVSQASANQRKGRCGRTSDGVCIRLYSEDDFASRPEFTEPEILRTNLASVILQMTSLRLGDIARFPFIDPPDRRSVKDGLDLLGELGALDGGRLTRVGRRLAQIPADPRLARMLLEAGRLGCAREVLVIVAALSIQDPRERPADRQERADELHRRFADKASDFLTWLNLWRLPARTPGRAVLQPVPQALPGRVPQLPAGARVAGPARPAAGGRRDLGIRLNPGRRARRRPRPHRPAGRAAQPHRAQAGRHPRVPGGQGHPVRHLARVGAGQEAAPVGDGGRAGRDLAAVGPGGGPDRARVGEAAGRPPGQAELRRAALVAVARGGDGHRAGHPVRGADRDRPAGQLRPGRPAAARELFLRHALVEGDWETSHEFFARNRRLLAEVEELEHRARRRDILVDDHALFDFYDRRIPDEVVSARHFDAWWKRASQDRPDLLDFERSMLIEEPPTPPTPATTPTPGTRTAPAAPDLPVRAGQRRRRRHRPRPPGRAQPGRAGRLRLAGPRAAPRAGHRADPVAAQGDPAQLHPGAQLGHLGPGSDRPGRRPAARGPGPRAGAGRAGRGPARGVRPGQGARPPAHDLPGGRPGLRPSWPWPGPGGRRGQGSRDAQAALAPRVRAAIAAAAPGLERDRVTPGTSARCPGWWRRGAAAGP